MFQDAGNVRRWTLGLLFVGALVGDALWHWLPSAQTPLALLLILGVGIQHGALDHILHAHMHGDPEGPLRQSFVLPYVGAIGVCWVLFEWMPSIMLGVFLLASAHHFGMSHLRVDAMRRSDGPVPDALSGTTLGLILLAPLVLRPDALIVLEQFGWTLSTTYRDHFLPFHLASASALLLAAVGIYGVFAYMVSRRTREIGMRLALGAQPERIRRDIMAGSAVLAVIGIVTGLLLSASTGPMLESLLYDVGATDPSVLFFAGGLLAGVALLASWIPARRASRIDPVEALRAD